MTRLILPILVWLSLTGAAHARCSGTDLGQSLLPEEQAAVAAQLANTPYATGNHWIARRDTEELHLIGTVHLSDPRLDGPSERLAPLVRQAALLLLEMTAADQKLMEKSIATDPSIFMLPDSSLPDLLPPDDWAMLSEAMTARGMPAFIGARMQPWYVSMLLTVPACMKDQLEQKDGLDFRLQEVAASAKVPTRSLEAFDTGFRLFNNIPMETQLSMVRAALAEPAVNEDLFETLLAAYFAEDHAKSQAVLKTLSPRLTPLEQAENDAVFRAMDDVMITGRNHAWIPVILNSLDNTDGPVIAAFGAAHLAGEHGVLNLLAQAGFTLERAPF